MVEVFKTNVQIKGQGSRLIARIHQTFPDYIVNIDLNDCDKILRVENANGFVDSLSVINIVTASGFKAEVLPDELFSFEFLLPQQFIKEL